MHFVLGRIGIATISRACFGGPKQLLVAVATIDFALSKQNQRCFELKV